MSPASPEQALILHPATAVPALWEASGSRSPAVSISIAVALLGCLLAGGAEWSLPHFTLTAALLFLASEIEVRRLQLPVSFGLCALTLVMVVAIWQGGIDALPPAAGGAFFFPFLLAPFLATGYLNRGTLAASASLGALWGPLLVPAVFVVTLVLAGVFIGVRTRSKSDLRNLPMTAVIGFAAALVQLIR